MLFWNQAETESVALREVEFTENDKNVVQNASWNKYSYLGIGAMFGSGYFQSIVSYIGQISA